MNQETLEQAAEKYAKDEQYAPAMTAHIEASFIAGANWKAQQLTGMTVYVPELFEKNPEKDGYYFLTNEETGEKYWAYFMEDDWFESEDEASHDENHDTLDVSGFTHWLNPLNIHSEISELKEELELYRKNTALNETTLLVKENHINSLQAENEKLKAENLRLVEQQVEVAWEIEEDKLGLSDDYKKAVEEMADEVFKSLDEEKKYISSLQSEIERLTKENEEVRCKNIAYETCNYVLKNTIAELVEENERLKGLIESAYNSGKYAGHHYAGSEEERYWQKFKTENQL